MNDKTVCLWKFYIDTQYSYVGGLFLATHDEIRTAIGQQIHICDAMGKHGEFTEQLQSFHFEFVTADQTIIDAIQHILPVGYDPLEYVRHYCPECGTYFSADEFDFDNRVCQYCSEKV